MSGRLFVAIVQHAESTKKISKKRVEAVAYPATNVGAEKDSDKRQRDAIQAFAKPLGYVIVAEFYDAAVKRAQTLVQTRPGFAAVLERIRARACGRSSSRPPTGSTAT